MSRSAFLPFAIGVVLAMGEGAFPSVRILANVDSPLPVFISTTIEMKRMPTKLERHAEQLAALGSPVRLAILRRIVQGAEQGTVVGDLQAKLDIPWSTLSHHLERLASAGLLKAQQQGKFVLYRAEYSALRALTDYLWEDCCKGGAGRGGNACC